MYKQKERKKERKKENEGQIDEKKDTHIIRQTEKKET